MTGATSTARFYAELEPFAEFERFTDFDAYAPVPDDWVVLAGDIAGSTRAIAEGRYKAVNMVGAAVIMTVLNACEGADVPFVFGGDGGAVAVPAEHADAGREALRRLAAHAGRLYGLTLRAAAVPVARLRREGADLRVRRMALNGSNHLAMFAGGGIDRADAILKAGAPDDPDVIRADESVPAPDLEGLSCRWEPLSAARGRMIALMVLPVGEEAPGRVLSEILTGLSARLGGNIATHAPASDATLRFRWSPRGLAMEVRGLAAGRGKLKAWSWALMTSAFQKLCHLRGLKVGDYDGPAYQTEIERQTDFRKYDGALRTVLDCSEDEVEAIRTYLDAEHEAGRIVYGMHVDRTALMTCLVFSLAESRHVHFIDAAGGGFARASEGFKAQLRSRAGA